MPIYEYECPRCGCFEHSQSITEKPLAQCPTCRRKVRKLLSASAFHLKGGGWYSDGYEKKNGATGVETASTPDPKPAGGGTSTNEASAPKKGSSKGETPGGKDSSKAKTSNTAGS